VPLVDFYLLDVFKLWREQRAFADQLMGLIQGLALGHMGNGDLTLRTAYSIA